MDILYLMMSARLRGTKRKPPVLSVRVRDAASEIKAHQSAQTCINKLENNFRIMLIIIHSTVISTLRDSLCNNIIHQVWMLVIFGQHCVTNRAEW